MGLIPNLLITPSPEVEREFGAHLDDWWLTTGRTTV